LFDKVTIRLDPKYTKGGTFTITARNNSADNIYIQSAQLNGKPLDRCWITHEEIVGGGTLELVLGPQPNQKWGLAAQ
jgi:putative alpha-1,2-mannosidase